MAWKFVLDCPSCRRFGYGRKERACANCVKPSTLSRPSGFLPKGGPKKRGRF